MIALATSLNPRVAGGHPVSYRTFEKVLGKSAFSLWLTLRRHRDKTGQVSLSIRQIAWLTRENKKQLNTRQVARNLIRLRQAGLLRPGSWRYLPTRGQRDTGKYDRVLRGELGSTAREGNVVFVPAETARWLETTGTHGGLRKGAGNPHHGPDGRFCGTALTSTYQNGGIPYQNGGCRGGARPIKTEEVLNTTSVCVCGFSNVFSKEKTLARGEAARTPNFLSGAEEEVAAAAAAAAVTAEIVMGKTAEPAPDELASKLFPEKNTLAHAENEEDAMSGDPAPAILAAVTAAPPVAAAPVRVPAGGLGTALGGASPGAPCTGFAWWLAAPGRFGGCFTPPYPGFGLLALAVVPGPQELPVDAALADKIALVARAYEGALEARYGVKSWAFRRGDITRSKYYPVLAAAVTAFEAHGIAPAAWVAFSLDIWAHSGKHSKAKSPPITWIFQPSRIEKQRGWFHREAANYRGGAVRITAPQRALHTRYTEMQDALYRAQTREEAQAIVDRAFPGDLWDTLLAQAQAAGREEQHALNIAASRGRWLWE